MSDPNASPLEWFDLEFKYWGSFMACCAICLILQIINRNGSNEQKTQSLSLNPKFVSFQRNYLMAYLLAMFADWLQGPYIYELYVSYGYASNEIAQLFVSGYASSMLFGTFVGGLADKYGRKTMCLLYCLCYFFACITKLSTDYWILMFGRCLSGISTSLLFSVFESWMVCEHHRQGFDNALISSTFAYATFGNGVVAVLAGLFANLVAGSHGYVAPFVMATLPLIGVATIVSVSWTENFGNQSMPVFSSLGKGFALLRNEPRIAALGLAQSCFEGGMYTFVFMWTPALKSAESNTASNDNSNNSGKVESTSDYLGLIFAVFMLCVMIGSTIFKIFSFSKETLYKIPLIVHSIACLAMFTTSITLGQYPSVVYIMFLVFETCVGCFYPVYGTIKSEKIPEEIRSAVMNIFR